MGRKTTQGGASISMPTKVTLPGWKELLSPVTVPPGYSSTTAIATELGLARSTATILLHAAVQAGTVELLTLGHRCYWHIKGK